MKGLSWKQLLLLALASRGFTASEAARLLGVTRQDAAATLRRARARVRDAVETLRAHAAASGAAARAAPGEPLEALLERLLRNADEAGIRLRVSRSAALDVLRGLLEDRLSNGVLVEEACAAVEPLTGLPLDVDCGLLETLEAELERLGVRRA